MVPYDPLRNQQQDAPFLNQLSNLDQQLQTILNDNSLPPELKLQKYTQTLQRYQSLKSEQMPTRTLPVEPAKPKIETDGVLDAIPKPFKSKANLLMQHMNKYRELFDWTPDGRLKFQGTPIHGSHILDLVYDFSRKKGPLSEPAIGARQFARLLKETNVPKVAIGNPDRMQEPLLHNSRFAALLDEEDSDYDEYRTPERKGRLDESWLTSPQLGVPKSPITPVAGEMSKRKKIKQQQKRYPTRNRKPVKRFDPETGHGYIKQWVPY